MVHALFDYDRERESGTYASTDHESLRFPSQEKHSNGIKPDLWVYLPNITLSHSFFFYFAITYNVQYVVEC